MRHPHFVWVSVSKYRKDPNPCILYAFPGIFLDLSDSMKQLRMHKQDRSKRDSFIAVISSVRNKSDALTKCLECDFVTGSAQGLYRHMKGMHPQARPYQCTICGQWFGSPHDRWVHENSVHIQKVLNCDLCNFSTYNQFCLSNHQCTHSNHKLQCEHCNVSLSSASALKEHIARHFDISSVVA